MNENKKFKAGQKVTCNGNNEGIVIGYYSEGMVEVRLFCGSRHIGSVCVSESGLILENSR